MVTSFQLTDTFNKKENNNVSPFFTSMSVFEQLQPFVSLCQACGLFPYRIERNSTTGKFERFTFSVKHCSTWWFLTVLVLQITIVVMMGNLSRDFQEVLSTDKSIPITLFILNGVTSLTFLAQLVSSRWIAFNCRHLGNAVEAVQKVEVLFGEKFVAEHRSSIMTRFFIGFAVIIITSSGMIFAIGPVFALLLPVNTTAFSITALSISLASVTMMFDCSLLFVHICYYITAHYIQLVLLHCDKKDFEEIQGTIPKRRDNIEMAKRSALIFGHLCRASSDLDSIFSLPAFFVLGIKFVTVISTAFAYIYRFLVTNILLESAIWIYSFLFLTESIRLLVLLTAADMPVRLLRERVTAMSLSGFAKTMAEKITMMILLEQVDEERVHLSAAGLFKVGVHLIPALIGAVVTYMAILLQN
ncbi:hypothetical protein GHT06_009753 [Daphnia sinensis]|uniref:Gustatory receptor n=1 Tax=Daphnia sinensis TaxID=1820382 RepID=A0AAD5LPQ8_9CRUS|nr:hypothetical protein GHT06_009753 [Daphnia sinensis]